MTLIVHDDLDLGQYLWTDETKTSVRLNDFNRYVRTPIALFQPAFPDATERRSYSPSFVDILYQSGVDALRRKTPSVL